MADELYKKIAAIEQPLIDKGEIDWKWQAVGPCKTRQMTPEEIARHKEKYKDHVPLKIPGSTNIGPFRKFPFDDEDDKSPPAKDAAD